MRLINVPKEAKRGEVIAIKTLISHEMETGFRYDNAGKPIPRNIINLFVCTYNGVEIFRADCILPFPPTRSSSFIRWLPIAASSNSNGRATTVSRRPNLSPSPSI